MTNIPYLKGMQVVKKIIPDSFAEEVSHRLHSSLDIEKALYEVFCYLKDFIPVDNIHANIIHTKQNYVRYLATATLKDGGVLIDERIALPENLMVENFSDTRHGEVSIYNEVSKVPVVRELLRNRMVSNYADHVQESSLEMSMMAIAFKIGHPLIGFFVLIARGGNQYSESHKNLLKSLERPLTGAVLNLFHHREVQIRNEQLERNNASLHDRLGLLSATRIIGAETGLKKVMKQIRKVALTESPVLISGETGAGKEVVARTIHNLSRRSKGPILCINCGAIPENLMDRELFGHERGDLPGTSDLKRGYFEQANGGTIFLDEIAELSLEVQAKLLSVLEEKSFFRVGAGFKISVDIRIIAATNKPLAELVQKNIFREDLWFRLNVFPIHVPPLRERKEDLESLAEYFAVRSARDMKLKFTPRFSPEAIEQLQNYNWPGNIREFQNVIERSMITSNGAPLSFPFLSGSETQKKNKKKSDKKTILQSFPVLDTVISNHIVAAIELASGKIDGKHGAAELLGLNPSTLRGKMRKLGIIQKKTFKNNAKNEPE